ncbi:hypothetical protein O3M35_010780 [Rhynocoris fuscipes]|uniref:mannosyl-oligosaccharide 1,3-1,6-alpha-mannosidase n=1 Tax=Rhynocoris fuscipes TaxID=488301 RepID=A0AAW1D0D6_9HEMI
MSEYNTNLITLGGDFRFDNATEWYRQFRNYMAIINYISANNETYGGAKIKFSTLSNYFSEIPSNPKYLIKGDFFPYCDLTKAESNCWTGYYTTRPYHKKLARVVEANLRATEILYTLTLNTVNNKSANNNNTFLKLYKKLIRSRRTNALFQHHDGITGTSKSQVMKYYTEKLKGSFKDLKYIQSKCIKIFFNFESKEIIKKLPVKIVLFNSLGHYVNIDVRITISTFNVNVTRLNTDEVPYQIVTKSNGRYEVIILPLLKPLSINIYEIHGTELNTNSLIKPKSLDEKEFVISNDVQTLYFVDGFLNYIFKDNDLFKVSIHVKGYRPLVGKSGAYLFKPDLFDMWYVDKTQCNVFILNGDIYNEVRTKCSLLTLVTRLYKVGDLKEIVEIIVESNLNEEDLELTLTIKTDMKNAEWYTDVNDFIYRKRILVPDVKLEGNYYPMTSTVFIENDVWRLSLLSDHSHGTAQFNGHLEVMLNRRISVDDGKGLNEGVTENIIASSKFYLFIEIDPTNREHLFYLSKILNNPIAVHIFEYTDKLKDIEFLYESLKFGVHLVNFRTLTENINRPSNKALLVLHNHNENTTIAPFHSSEPFTLFKENSIMKTKLTGVEEIEEIDSLDEVKISPSTLVCLKVKF